MRFQAAFVRTTRPSFSSEGRFDRVPAMVLVLFAACAAAIIAHVVIDLLGDVLLVRDAYDFEAHASRNIALDAALFGAFAVAWYLLSNAVAEARDGKHVLRAAAERIVAGPAWLFIARVTLATVVVLAFMGALDAQLDSLRLDDFADLLGGSSVLGLSVSVPLGAVVGLVVFGVMRWIARSHRAIVAAVIALILAIVRAQPLIAGPQRQDRIDLAQSSISALARQAGKRAPPALFA